MNYYWLNKHLSQWQGAMQNNLKPQAVIIGGTQGMGKPELSRLIINDLLCRVEETGYCGLCQNCILYKKGHHPDVESITAEKHVIKVKMIRELTDFFTSTPHCSDYKVGIIHQAELMNVAAANALLKVLEEPPTRGVIFLVTDNKHQLMPTIRSRCISLDVQLNQQDKRQLPGWLKENSGKSQQLVNDVIALCDSQPLEALSVLQSDQTDQFKRFLDTFYGSITDQISISQAAKDLNDYAQISDWLLLQRFCLQIIKSIYEADAQGVFAEHPLNQMIKKSPKVVHIIIKITDLAQQFMLNLNTQIKTQLLLESMLVEIKSEVNLGS